MTTMERFPGKERESLQVPLWAKLLGYGTAVLPVAGGLILLYLNGNIKF